MHRFISFPVTALFAGALFASDLPLCDSVSIDGITWKLEKKAPIGRFVTGDYYVVGSVVIASVRPAPNAERNGSVLNPPANPDVSGFDGRVRPNRFRRELRASFPLTMRPGDALVSSISLDSIGSIEPWLREGNNEKPDSPVRSYSILTCLSAPVSPRAFRPSYCDRRQKTYSADSLRREILPNLRKVPMMPDIKQWAWHFRRPWLDICFFSFDAAAEYQAMYGRETARSVGMGTLMLCCDYPAAEKDSLLIPLVQYGIDLWGMVRAGYPGWPAHGGHGSGRKWPIIFAGLMLGDSLMMSPTRSYPSVKFGEDMQTMYAKGWTGANALYAGHQGKWKDKPVSSDPNWGPYEHMPPSQWPCDEANGCLGENYRRCCTSLSWVGEALSARIMKATALWAHGAFFDYVDRWMSENDSASVLEIREAKGKDYSARWARQRQCWDTFVENMWSAYRPSLSSTPPKQMGPHRRKASNEQ